jgi:peroxiredoxin
MGPATAIVRALVLGAAAVCLLEPAAPVHAGVAVGDPAPAFTLTDRDERPVTLASLRGDVVVLHFTASWCVACRTALPALAALTSRYADRGVVLVTVDIDAAREAAERHLAELLPSPPGPVLFDPTARLLARFGAAGMPALYVIDGAGIVRAVESGYDAAHVQRLATVIDGLLPPDDATRRAARP